LGRHIAIINLSPELAQYRRKNFGTNRSRFDRISPQAQLSLAKCQFFAGLQTLAEPVEGLSVTLSTKYIYEIFKTYRLVDINFEIDVISFGKTTGSKP
jgi:hypothetical protein